MEDDSSQRYCTPRQQISQYGRLTHRLSPRAHGRSPPKPFCHPLHLHFIATRTAVLNAQPERLHFPAGLRPIHSRPNSGEIHWPITHPDGQLLVSLRSGHKLTTAGFRRASPAWSAPHCVSPSISHHGSPYGAPPPASEAETVHSMVTCALFSRIVRRSEIICRRMCAAHGREHGIDQRGCSDNNSTYIQPNLIHGVLQW